MKETSAEMATSSTSSEPRDSRLKASRRGFLKGAAAIAGSLFSAGVITAPEKAFAKELAVTPDRYGMLTDLTRCVGCRRCEAACNRVHNLPRPSASFENESVFEHERELTATAYTVVNRYESTSKGAKPVYRKVQCNHCEEPACASACLVGAMKKSPEGPVVYNPDVCLGCRYCMVACPFHVPAYEYSSALDPKVQKCNMCSDRIAQGLLPACAEACPVEAVVFGKRSQLIEIARGRIRSEPARYVNHIYGEREAGGTSWFYLSSVPFDQVGFERGVSTTAYPEFTKDFLSFVPLVLVSWPTLFGGFYLFSKRREQLEEEERGTARSEEER